MTTQGVKSQNLPISLWRPHTNFNVIIRVNLSICFIQKTYKAYSNQNFDFDDLEARFVDIFFYDFHTQISRLLYVWIYSIRNKYIQIRILILMISNFRYYHRVPYFPITTVEITSVWATWIRNNTWIHFVYTHDDLSRNVILHLSLISWMVRTSVSA